MSDKNIPGIDDHTGREVIRSSSVRPVNEWKPPTIGPFVPPAERGLGLYQNGPIATTAPLTEAERTRLAQHEETIRAGLQTFHEVGTALLDIRDSRLYREEYTSFEAYCESRWNMKRNYANKLIAAAEVMDNLKGTTGTLPENERQVRELAKMAPEAQLAAWATAVETAPGGKVTANHIAIVASVFENMLETGAIDPGDGIAIATSDIVKAAVVEETYERVKRQENYILDAMADKEAKKNPAQHILQSNSNEWYTPARYVEAARQVMGAIDIDPASNDMANETVRATVYYTLETNGLDKDWPGRVWLNPPYGQGMGGKFTEKLLQQFTSGITTEAILLVNAHVTETGWFRPCWDYLICFTDHRINYISPDGVGDGSGSTHGSLFVYMGENRRRFVEVFSEIGPVVRRVDRDY